MTILIGLLALLVGILNTVQSGANSTLNKVAEAPFFATMIVTAGGVSVYLVSGLFTGFAMPAGEKVGQLPWWTFVGGALGALYILSMIFLAQKLGSAVFTGLTVTAAVITSVLLDHFGLLGFQQHPAGLWRIAGCGLMVGGLALISVF